MKRSGFTLMEVVVALLVLETAVVAAAGTFAVASRTLTEADRLERAIAGSEGVIDSLASERWPSSGRSVWPGLEVSWTVDSVGTATVAAMTDRGDTLFTLGTRLGR